MHIGYDGNSGHVYEGANLPEFAVVPAPLLTQARLVESPDTLNDLPRGLHQTPLNWIFREEPFDAVTRVRRGRLYEPHSEGQPRMCLTRGHPAHQFVTHRDNVMSKELFHFWPCQTLINRPRAGSGMELALGQAGCWSKWRIVQVERVVGDDVLVTLKALSAFGILPDLRVDAIAEQHREPLRRAIERVLDSAFRESPISVIDQCRNAAVVLLSRWMVAEGAPEKTLESDLGALVRRARDEFDRPAIAGVAEMVARLHPRGKANEQEVKGYRLAQEEDAEAAVHAIGFIMRELRWAL